MDKPFDANVPDCSNGDFYCNLCLASMNSEQMWSSHIAGKRHIKNMTAYPNGLPRDNFDDENSYDRPPKMRRYDDMDDYLPPPEYLPPEAYPDYPDYYEDDYYNRRPPPPPAYVPEVRRVVVHDYGHKKVDEPTVKNEPKKAEGFAQEGPPPKNMEFLNGGIKTEKKIEKIDIDSIIDEVKKSVAKENCQVEEEPKKKDDFFAKLNEKFLAEDLAEEIVKKRLQEQKNKVQSKPKPTESPKEQKNDNRYSNEKKNRDSSPDVRDNGYKYKDNKYSKSSDSDKKSSSSSKSSSSKSSSSKSSSSKSSSSKSSSSKSSSSKSSLSQSEKSAVKLDKIDPDDLTPDMLDDLLSSYLKPKMDSVGSTTDKEPKKKEVNLDNMYALAQKINDLPVKTFLQLALEKMRHINLKDAEELQLIFQVICQAQNIICKKLPAQLQAVVKEKMSRNYSNTQSEVTSTPVSQQSTVTPVVASYNSLIQNAAVALNTTAVQMQQPIMAQAGPITSVSLPTQSTPVLQSNTNQSVPQLPMYQQPVYPTSLTMGTIPPNYYPYMYGAQAAGAQQNFVGVPPSWSTVASTAVSQSQPTNSTSILLNKINAASLSTPPPPPPRPTLSYQPSVSSTSLPTGAMNPNFNLLLYQAQAAAGGFSTATGLQSNSVNYSTAGQTDRNYYKTINSTVGNALPVVSPSTTSVASSSSSRKTEAALASLKSLAEEYASKNKNSSEESRKKTEAKRLSRWR